MAKVIGRYTTAVTKQLKEAAKDGRAYCRVSEEYGILVSNSCYLFSMTQEEYDGLARPVFQRDPGSFYIDKLGAVENGSPSFEKLFAQAVRDSADAKPAQLSPVIVEHKDKKAVNVRLFYTPAYSLVTGYAEDFIASIDDQFVACAAYTTADRRKGLYLMDDGKMFAMILPINSQPCWTRAVTAYYIEDAESDADKAMNEMRAECAKLHDELEAMKIRLKNEIADAEKKSTATDPAPAAVATSDTTDNADSDRQPTTLQELAGLDGVELVIKGRQTDSPVSWIYGAEKYKELLQEMGFRWSAKKSGYWKKGIAA